MGALSMTRHQLPDAILIEISGEIDATNHAALEERLAQTHPRPHETLILDLGAVPFMDSSGLRLLLRTQNRLDLDGKNRLRLVAPQTRLLRLMEVTGAGSVLNLHADLDHAIAAVERHATAHPALRRPSPIGLVLPPHVWTTDPGGKDEPIS
ncbi:STAS domain-containing protein [Nonomuraea sp. NPDC050404]|uniref:STAS domain-containing protein n=1 Tax=Nonomuraea sp. NPDC050404 TaxID=3155783 RepID=UPI003404F82B